MKLLVIKDAKPKRTGTLWDELARKVDTRFLEVAEGDSIAACLAQVDPANFDRVVYAAGLIRLGREATTLRQIDNLVVFGLDFCQDYVRDSDYYRRYSALVKSLGPVRLVVTGMHACRHFNALGIPTSSLPKGYDGSLIRDLGIERTIEYGFIGRTKHKVYKQRRQLLAEIGRQLPLTQSRTADASEESAEYNELLSRIRFFISADAGFEEYMIKNFEAMAAGCVLCTLPTADEENRQLGLVDMENVIFYRSADELVGKLERVRQTPGLADGIAAAGRRLAEERHTWRQRAGLFVDIIKEPVGEPAPAGFADKLRLLHLKAQFLVEGR